MSEKPHSDQIRLIQAVLWLALDLPPREERFAKLEEYPQSIERISSSEGLTDSQIGQIRVAKKTILRALMEGKLSSSGRPLYIKYNLDDPYQSSEMDDYWRAFVEQQDVAAENIPAEFWQPDKMAWDSDSCGDTKIVESERPSFYLDIRLSYREVTRLKVDPPGAVETPAPTPKGAGRPRNYDQAEFLIYCIHCANVDGLPDRQAEFLRRMDLLLQVLWGPDNVPGETWLKERISQIYRLREKFESGRQRAQGEED